MQNEILNQFVTMLQDKVNAYFMANYKESFLQGCHRTEVKVKDGKKYIKINIGDSGKFMLDTTNNHLYFIKGYGTIDKAKDFGDINDIVKADFDYDSYSIVAKGSGKRSMYGYAGKVA